MKKITVPAFALALLLGTAANAQVKVGTNPTNLNSSAVFEMESASKGMLLPRVALTSTDNASPLSSLVSGMVVYNTATAGSGTTAVKPGFYYCDGTKWVASGSNLSNTALISSTSPAGASTGDIIYNTTNLPGLPVGPAYWDGTQWVSIINSGGGSSTASNGLTESSGEIKLGGTLTNSTTIDQANNDLTFTTGTGKAVVNGTFKTTGAVYAKVRKVTSLPMTWADDDYMVIISLIGAQNISLPSPGGANEGRVICIRNGSVDAGGSGTYTITVNTPASNTSILPNRGAIFISDGTAWYLMAGV